jgi:hypothetical protein
MAIGIRESDLIAIGIVTVRGNVLDARNSERIRQTIRCLPLDLRLNSK